MSTDDFASGSDASNSSGGLGGVANTHCGGISGLGCEGRDEGERANSSHSGSELASHGNAGREARREGCTERYSDAHHSDDLLSPILLGQQFGRRDLASGNVSSTFEPVLGSEVLSSHQGRVNQMTDTEVGRGSPSLLSQQLPSPTTKVGVNLSAPLPPEGRLEGAFESSVCLFGAIKESSGAGDELFASPKRDTAKPEDGQPVSNEGHGGRATTTKTKKAGGVKSELNCAAFNPLGGIGPRQRHENQLSGGFSKTSSQQTGPVRGLQDELACPTSAGRRLHLSKRVKSTTAVVKTYLSMPSEEAKSSPTLPIQGNQSQAILDDGQNLHGLVTSTLHEYNEHDMANDIERYRMAGFRYPGHEYFSHAPPSGPSPTRPYQREAGVYRGEFDWHGPRSRRSTQRQSQRSPPVIGGVVSFEEVSVPTSMLSRGSLASQGPRPFNREAERYRVQFLGHQPHSEHSMQGQSQRFPRILSRFSDSRDGIDALISSLSAEKPTLEAVRTFYRQAAVHRGQSLGTQSIECRQQPRVFQASDHCHQSQRNQSHCEHDARPKLSVQEAPLSSVRQQTQQQHRQEGPHSVTQMQRNITLGLSMRPATLPATNASTAATAATAAPQADNMAPTFVPLLSESYFQQLRIMYTTGGQESLVSVPSSQMDNTSSDLSMFYLARPNQSQLLAAHIPRALNLAFPSEQGSSRQPQHAHSTSSGKATGGENSSLFLNMANTQRDTINAYDAHLNQGQATVARISGTSQHAQDPPTQLQRGLHFPFSLPPGTVMPGTSAPYIWHHRGGPPLQNPANINDPITQLSLYERHIINALGPKVTALMTENTAVFAPILNANGKVRRMVLQELPALTPEYCDDFDKFTLRLTLTIRTLLQLHLIGYWDAVRTKLVKDLQTNCILLFAKMQERIRLESEMLEEQMEKNGAVLSAFRQARPPPPPRLGDDVLTPPPPPLAPSQHSSSAPSTGVRLITGAREAATADTFAQQGTPARPPVPPVVISPPVRVETSPSRSAEERAELFRAALARNGVRTSREKK